MEGGKEKVGNREEKRGGFTATWWGRLFTAQGHTAQSVGSELCSPVVVLGAPFSNSHRGAACARLWLSGHSPLTWEQY